MLLKKCGEKLTVRIFLITALILFCASALTFGLIALATPVTYTAAVNRSLTAQAQNLADQLETSPFKQWGGLMDGFIRSQGAEAILAKENGQAVDTGSLLALKPAKGNRSSVLTWNTDQAGEESVAITMDRQDAIAIPVRPQGQKEAYVLYVFPRIQAQNLAAQALLHMAPWLFLALLSLSLCCALALDHMARRLSAASHELKTPVTILKGQLSEMLEGVGVYQNRDKYLLRSLQAVVRIERLIHEMLTLSKMEKNSSALRLETLDLADLIRNQVCQDEEFIHQRRQRLVLQLEPGILVEGDFSLLQKAAANLLSNAVLYSPPGACIRLWCGMEQGRAAFTVENTGGRIPQEALPRLFEAFYRAEGSRSRSTGGSGLGLYLVRMILEQHRASCRIENTADGVKTTVHFPIISTENT